MSATEDDRIEALIAREEIRSLPIRYAAAVEARDVDAMAELFSPHARFGSYGEGPDGLRRLMTDSLTGSLFAVILVANHLSLLDVLVIFRLFTQFKWKRCLHGRM